MGHGKNMPHMRRLSQFNIYLPGYPSHDSALVYNLLTGGFCAVPTEHGQDTSRWSEELRNDAIATGVCLEDGETDHQRLSTVLENAVTRRRVLDLTLLMTYQCNSRCPYCYENRVYRRGFFGQKETKELARWTTEYLRGNALEEIDFCFHGGEPLLSYRRIVSVAEAMKRTHGDTVLFSVVTNGTLINRVPVEELLSLGIATWQVTLDGVGGNHNRCRPLVKGDSFKRIVSGLKLLQGARRVVLNLNLSVLNAETICADLRILLRSGALPDNVRIRCSLVRDLCAESKYQLSLHESAELVTMLTSILADAGHRYVLEDALPVSVCSALSTHSFVISPTGAIRQCISAVEFEDAVVGSLMDPPYQPQLSPLGRRAQARWQRDPCRMCTYLPICMGRCEFERYTQAEQAVCRRDYYNVLVPATLKLKFRDELVNRALRYNKCTEFDNKSQQSH